MDKDDLKISNQIYEIICNKDKYKKIVNNPNWDGILKFNNMYYSSPTHLYDYIIYNTDFPDEKNDYYKFTYYNNKTKIVIMFKCIDDIISYIFEYPTEICNHPLLYNRTATKINILPIILDWH